MKTKLFFAGCILALTLACSQNPNNEEKVIMQWSQSEVEGQNFANVTLCGLPKGNDWQIVFSQMPNSFVQKDTAGLVMRHYNGNLFTITPTEDYDGQTTLSWQAPSVLRYDLAPVGAFIVLGDGTKAKVEVEVKIDAVEDGPSLYAQYEGLATPQVSRFDIIPRVKDIKVGEVQINLSKCLALIGKDVFPAPVKRLEKELSRIGISVSEGGFPVEFAISDLPLGGYRITASSDKILIEASGRDGAFSAVASLVAFLEQGERTAISTFTAYDYPDLHYRGMMVDVARNFTTKENLIRLIDELARLKMNVLHLHLIDDEAWRLEWPKFPELTSLSAHHQWDGDCLMPSYDCNFDPTSDASSNGYYSAEDFVEILRAADAAGLTVLPEIESPGHARAAIKAMEAYARRTGDNSYLLSDPDDESKYLSAQCYTDNVMNVAMESTYTFMAEAIDYVSELYSRAGLTLEEIHIGGDEVPGGSWTGSPLCKDFMKSQGMKRVHDLKTHFVRRMTAICRERGIKVSGWQEMPLYHDRRFDSELQEVFGSANCWSTIAQWGSDDVPYALANRGYNVILSNVTNTYVDLAYTRNRNERGLRWGGTMTLKKSFALNPYNNYCSALTKIDDTPIDLAKAAVGKPALRRPECIRGVQAQLFAETLRSFDDVTLYIFPKALGVFERGWNAYPSWYREIAKSKAGFEADYRFFESVVYSNCMPRWSSLGFNFHLPQPGLVAADSGSDSEQQFLANSPIPGAEIVLGEEDGFYTATLQYLGRSSVPTYLRK